MRRNLFYSFLAMLGIILAGAMIIYPQSTFEGAVSGLKTWGLVLVPALLPFFIISQVLVELGVVRLLGVFLDPLMRPLFKQPGESGFVLAMGFTTGFPMGAVLTNTLYEKNMITREEAGRLIAFTNNSSPLFLLVAIPIGMFNNPRLGIILLLCHYGANLLLGFTLGIIAKDKRKMPFYYNNPHVFKKNLLDFFDYQKKSAITIGSLLGNAVNKSIQNMLTIGGFVIFFAVLIQILQETSLFYIISLFFSKVLQLGGISPNLGTALTTGFFEMTLGAQKAAQINAPIDHQLMLVSLILGWSGLSIQAQVASIAARNNIPIIYYLGGRFFQGILSFLLTLILFEPLANIFPVGNFDFVQLETLSFIDFYSLSFLAILMVLSSLLLLSGLFKLTLNLKNYFQKLTF